MGEELDLGAGILTALKLGECTIFWRTSSAKSNESQ